jgi:hypothetical protein
VIKKPQYRGGQGSSMGCSAIGKRYYAVLGVFVGKKQKKEFSIQFFAIFAEITDIKA